MLAMVLVSSVIDTVLNGATVPLILPCWQWCHLALVVELAGLKCHQLGLKCHEFNFTIVLTARQTVHAFSRKESCRSLVSHTSNSLNSKALHRWSYLKQNTVRTTFATSRLICTQFHQTAPFTNNSVIRCMLLHSVFSHFCQSLYAWSAMTLHMILSNQRFSAQLLPTSLAHIPAHPSDSSAHKQLSPRNAIRNVQLSHRA